MKKSGPIIVSLCFGLFLVGCGWTDLAEPDVIAFAAEPAYNRTDSGRIVAASCVADGTARDETFTKGLPGCGRDTVFAAQVAHPSHLTHPARPGAAAAAPIAAAASTYLYGGSEAVSAGSRSSSPGQIVLLPQNPATGGTNP